MMSLALIASALVTYTIPASQGLDYPLTMPVAEASLSKEGNVALMNFKLPKEITGGKLMSFELEGEVKGNEIRMLSKDSDADCRIFKTATMCEIVFKNFDRFTLPNTPELEIDSLKMEHQPIGIFYFPHEIVD